MLASLRRVFFLEISVTLLFISFALDIVALDDFANVPGRGCGTVIPHDKAVAFERRFLELQKRQAVSIEPRTFGIHWTVVTANETVEGGWIPQEQLNAQINVLNKDYAEAGISWRLAEVKYVHNRDWFVNAWQQTDQERQMKYLFRGGDASIMNLYTIALVSLTEAYRFNSSIETLGFAAMPQWFPNDPVGDGVVIRYTTMPGGAQQYYNFGRTLTHETGHWLGLYHTFQGGCDGDGDFVADTPPEATASKGCPTGRDSCPGGGPDPIHNFMDYSVDGCMTGFTPGQIQRMHQFIQAYRQPSNENYTFPYWTDQRPF